MKRIIYLVFALALAMSAVCGAAAAEKTFKTDYFTLKLPSGWDYDTGDADKAMDEDGMQYLGYFGEDKAIGMLVEAYLVLYEDLQDFSLWKADEDEKQAYAEAVMDDYAEDDPEDLGIVMAGNIPFVLIKGTDEDGEYLYADTMTNGFAIIMIAYVLDEDGETQYPISRKYVEQFKSILGTFQPVS